MAVNIASLQDSRLRAAAAPQAWRLGSAVEVFSKPNQRWAIGWILEVMAQGVYRVLVQDGHGGAPQPRLAPRAELASVGTHLRALPPDCELTEDGGLLYRPGGRRVATFEEAWTAHFELRVKPAVASMLTGPSGAVTMRAPVVKQPGVQPIQVQASSAAVPTVRVARVAPAGGPPDTVTAVMTGPQGAVVIKSGSYVAPALNESRAHEEHWRQRCEAAEQAAAELRRRVGDLEATVQDLQAELQTVRDERDQLRREAWSPSRGRDSSRFLANERSLSAIPDDDGSPNNVVRSSTGGSRLGRERGGRSNEVLVSFTIPRVLTEEERAQEEARKRPSNGLAPGVVRLPSAPPAPQAASQHPLAMAPHRASVVTIMPQGRQPLHSAAGQLQQKPAQVQIATAMHPQVAFGYRR